MSNPIELSSYEHLKKRIDLVQAIRAFRTAQVVRLRIPEVGNAACCFPVFFTKDPHQGQWDLSGLTALEPESNLFVDDSGWQAVYSPLAVRTYPTCLIRPNDNMELRLAIDPTFLGEAGESLYDEKGEESTYLEGVKQSLEEDLKGALATQEFCRYLHELGLIKPINIQVKYRDNTSRILEGLYILDQDALSALADDTQLDLQKRGYMMAIHSMLISLFQLNHLIQKHNKKPGARSIQKIVLQRR